MENLTVSEQLQNLLKINAETQAVTQNFNIIDELHANENAHTRILASLLNHSKILYSFLLMIQQKQDCIANFKNLTTEELKNVLPENAKIFSDYMDLTIQSRNFTIILENKIHDAIDQDGQIARYVETAIRQGNQKIYVLYLTLNGDKRVDNCSFTPECRVELEKRGGGFIAVNYTDDILPWLKSQIKFSVEEQLRQPYLQSGIIQYIDHLEGLTGSRKPNDPLFEYKRQIRALVGSANDASALLTEITYYQCYWRSYWQRNHDKNHDFKIDPEEDVQKLLYSVFYDCWNKAHSDINGWTFLGTIDNTVSVCVYHWSNISPLQFELYRDGVPVKEYQTKLSEIKDKLCNNGFAEPLSIPDNETELLRYPINSLDDVYKISEQLISNKPVPFPKSELDGNALNIDLSKLNLLKKCLTEIFSMQDRYHAVMDSDSLKEISQKTNIPIENYFYDDHDIALHVYPHDAEKILVAEMWAKDGDPAKIIQKVLRLKKIYPFFTYYWRNKTLLEFPIISSEYGLELIKELQNIQKDL